ncbi:MAG: chromosome segregation protein SMC [SAR324 cluster bacterium]|nr:chromosome segregation protein SMC [SAR324 cluster bacterium]
MRLKRLKLNGFKSFCDETVLDFEQNGITLVVGPNGCGKSNVVDAIRWVLGEQSPSFLRGQAMGDVIFNGSATRKPVGRSEVTILFDNVNGTAPEKYRDYEEIAVTRRLYRSGESEYLINKIPCRLMDIRELVADTGAAGRSYSIVEQGRVDELITASPAERRIYMEEAAGIVRYKTKRIAAERKLEQTRQNLLRVQDLEGELHRQEEQLRGQRDKAQQFLLLRDQVNAMNARLARARYLSSVRLCTEMAQKRDAIQQKSILRQQALSTVQTRLQQLDLEQTGRETQLSESREAVRQQENEMQEQRTRQALETQNQGNREQWIGQINETVAEIRNRRHSLTEELASSEAELHNLTEREQNQGLEIERLEGEYSEKEAGKSAIDAEIQSLREQLLACHAEISGIGSQRQLLTERLADGERRREGLEAQAAITAEEQETVSQQLSATHHNLTRLREDMETGEERALELGRQIAAQSWNFEDNQKIQLDTEREIVEIRSRIVSLKEIEAGREGFEETVRKALEWAGQDPSFREEVGWMGPLADFISVAPQVAEWVGDILAPSLEYIAIRESAQLPRVQERLAAQELGGVKVVALDAYPASGSVAPEVATLADLVSMPAEFDALRKGLYGAVRLHAPGGVPHPLPMDGHPCAEWLAEDGLFHIDHKRVVALGQSATPAAGILRRRTEIASLEEQLKILADRQSAIATRVGELEAEAEILQDKMQEEETRRHEYTLRLSQVEQEQTHAEREAGRLAQVRSNMEDALTQLEAEAQSYGEQQITMAQHLSRLQAQQEVQETGLSAAQEKSNVAALSVATLNQQLTNRKVEHQEIRSKLEHIATGRGALRAEQEALAAKLAEAETNLETQRNALAEAERASEDIARKLAELDKELAGRRRSLLEDMGRYEEQESVRQNLAHDVGEERRKLEEVQSKRHEVELTLAEERTRMQQWAAQAGVPEGEPPAEGDSSGEEELDDKALEAELASARQRLEKMEGINLAAPEEYDALAERLEVLQSQKDDLESAIADLEESIRRMNQESRRRFKETFDAVNEKFQEIFPVIFNGGEAKLVLTDSQDLLLAGVDIVAQPPGKKLQNLNLLSGGEKALTAIALIFSFFLYKPSPFCLLDEVDAPLDDANVGRFTRLIQNMTDRSQFIIITHNKRTMEVGDLLYGVTMEEAGVSKIVSVNLAS